MYGLNGLHIRTNLKICMSYQMSKLVYGLEVLPLLKGDKDALDLYHRTVLKHLQHLPSGTSTAAVYLILVQLPASAILARNILALYVNMIRDPASVERLIIQRQLAVKGKDSKSWITTVKNLLHHYDLPSSYDLYTNPSYDLYTNPPPFENDLIGQMGPCILRLTKKMYVKYIHDIDVCDTK